MTNKTQPTAQSPLAFVEGIEHPIRRADGLDLLARMARITGTAPQMWGPTLIGFGSQHLVYDTGRELDFFVLGFSPRKAHLVLYGLLPTAGDDLATLGKHKVGKGCLYVNKLTDVDNGVLDTLITRAWSAPRG